MTSNIIPKEQLSAYQRWEMASFGEEPQAAPQSSAAIEQANAAELARLREEAQRQGLAAGFEQGQADGYAAGREEGRTAIAQESARLRQLADAFGGELAKADEAIAQDVLNLALDLAKAMLKTALAVKPELVLPVVSEAIRYLPSVQQPALLFLHPDDVAVVQTHMADELQKAGWRVAEDPHLERGGCRVETASNHIDASASGRWQRIAAALGHDSDWLA